MKSLLLLARSINQSDLLRCNTQLKLIVCMAICISISFVPTAQTRYFVNQAVATNGDGSNWGAAFKTLSEAIKVASSGVADEIWVAKGTDVPNTNQYGTVYEAPSFSYNMAFYIKKPNQDIRRI